MNANLVETVTKKILHFLSCMLQPHLALHGFQPYQMANSNWPQKEHIALDRHDQPLEPTPFGSTHSVDNWPVPWSFLRVNYFGPRPIPQQGWPESRVGLDFAWLYWLRQHRRGSWRRGYAWKQKTKMRLSIFLAENLNFFALKNFSRTKVVH